MTAAKLVPANGRCAATLSYNTTPSENRSERPSTLLPSACSGDMYEMVPSTIPASVCSIVSAESMDALAVSGLDELCQAEVQDFHQPAPRQHDVGALDVAMHDAAGVCFVERVCDLHRHVERVAHRHWPSRQTVGERLAIHVLHHKEGEAVLFPDVVDRRDVGRAQRRSGTRFGQ